MDEIDETNILETELIWIDNRCYRKIPIKGSEKKTYDQEDLFPTRLNEFRKEEEDDTAEDLPVKYDGNKFWITIYVPGPLIRMVCGKQQKTRKMIQETTHTTIKFPPEPEHSFKNSRNKFSNKREESGDVVITGATKESVCRAYRKIENIVNSGRWKVCDYTHFISIPMNSDSIQKGFLQFKEAVLKQCCSARGVSRDIFVHPSKLHLTIAMLTLFDDKDKELAKATVNKCKTEFSNILKDKSIKVQIKGIEYMNDDPGEVDVLYGIVKETDHDNSLQLLAEKLSESLIQVNLSRKEYDLVKLHVTLMKSKSIGEERNSFDARPLMQRFSEFVFGEITVNEIHISVRYTAKPGSYYTSVSVINL